VIAKLALAKVETPTVKAAEAKMADAWRDNVANRLPRMSDYPPRVIQMVLGGLVVLHLLFSFCCYSICTKAGSQPGILVWLPVFQTIPLLRAAGMSGWWFLAGFIPVLNIVAGVIWAVKIVNVRNLNVFVTILLLLPGLNLFGFLILAFASTSTPVKDQRKPAEIMSFEPV
jgi:hypothetical protein